MSDDEREEKERLRLQADWQKIQVVLLTLPSTLRTIERALRA